MAGWGQIGAALFAGAATKGLADAAKYVKTKRIGEERESCTKLGLRLPDGRQRRIKASTLSKLAISQVE